MTTIEFIFAVCVVALIILGWLILEALRHILDALHTLIAQNSKRREWKRED